MAEFEAATAEKALVSLCLVDPACFEQVKASKVYTQFQDISLKFIWTVIDSFHTNQKEWTWEVVADTLKAIEARPVDLQYPDTFLSALVAVAPDKGQVAFYISVLSERVLRSEITQKIGALQKMVNDPSVRTEELFENVRNLESSFQNIEVVQTRVLGQHNLLRELYPDLESISNSTFVGTGYDRLDAHLTWGFAPGQVSVIAARPSEGKSSFKLNVSDRLSKKNVHCINISLEQSVVDEYLRIISIKSGMSVQDIVMGLRGTGNNFSEEKFVESLKRMTKDWPHRIVEPRGLFFLKDIRRVVEDARRQGENPQIVFIDLFNQLSDFTSATDAGKMAGLIQVKMMEAANLARALQIHVCCIVQLRRMGKDKDKVDRQEQYKGGGGYEERADLMFQISRPGYRKPDEVEDNCMQIFIGKQRQGIRAKTVELLWRPHCLRIEDEGPDSPQMSEEEDSLTTF